MPVHAESHEQAPQGPSANELYEKMKTRNTEPRGLDILDEMTDRYMAKVNVPEVQQPQPLETVVVNEGPTRRDIKNARSSEERRTLNQASKIVRRVLGRTAVPVTGDVVPLEPMMQRGSYSDEAVAIATERLHKPYGIDVVVEESHANPTYEDDMYPGEASNPHRVIRVAGINDYANHTPTSHRK